MPETCCTAVRRGVGGGGLSSSRLVICTPQLWLDDAVAPGFSGSPGQWPLIPFSSGPAICPARNLVLLLGSHMLAALMGRHRFELIPSDRLNRYHPLPATLDHFSLRFRLLD